MCLNNGISSFFSSGLFCNVKLIIGIIIPQRANKYRQALFSKVKVYS